MAIELMMSGVHPPLQGKINSVRWSKHHVSLTCEHIVCSILPAQHGWCSPYKLCRFTRNPLAYSSQETSPSTQCKIRLIRQPIFCTKGAICIVPERVPKQPAALRFSTCQLAATPRRMCRMTEGASVLAGHFDHAGTPQMRVQPEEDNLVLPFWIHGSLIWQRYFVNSSMTSCVTVLTGLIAGAGAPDTGCSLKWMICAASCKVEQCILVGYGTGSGIFLNL